MRRTFVAGAAVAALALGSATALAAPPSTTPPTLERSGVRPAGPVQIELSVLGTYETGIFDQSAAEIVAHDPATQRLFVVNAQSGDVDVLDIGDPTDPQGVHVLATAGLPAADGSVVPSGSIANSVVVLGDTLAVAVEAPDRVTPGWAVFFATNGDPLVALRVGPLPDMITATPDGRTILVANEGEPNDDVTLDPEGSVSLIDVTGPISELTQADVRTADFGAWDRGEKELHSDVRVFGPDVPAPGAASLDEPGRIARNLEPEYIVADADSRTAYVVLQEANAVAVLDVVAGEFTDIWPFGFKDHMLPGNELDVSDRDGHILIENWPAFGMYQPDGFDAYRWRGQTLLVTANEGDSRDWPGYSEADRFRGITSNNDEVCPGSPIARFLADNPLGITTVAQLRSNTVGDVAMGRLTVTNTLGRGPDGRSDTGCLHSAFAFGARSFAIWTTDGELVWDSGSELERITAEVEPAFFNSNHRENSFETRSDDKGPEPEDVTIGTVAGRTYAFIGLERVGGVMVYDISDPRAPFFVQYLNNRDFSVDPTSDLSGAGDLGAEGLIFIEAKDSPTRRPMLAVANEVSGTTTLFDVSTVNPAQARQGR